MSDSERKATYEDLMHFHEHERAEVIDGQVRVQPSTRARHAEVVGMLTRFLPPSGRSGSGVGVGWWIWADIDVELGPNDIVRPDLVGWRKENLPRPPQDLPIRVRPDWVCEVLSPSNHVHDRKRKMPRYALAGVPDFWLVDPDARTLEAYVLGPDGLWVLQGAWSDGDRVRLKPFADLELDVGALFLPEDDEAPPL